jgi:PAS domain S-box-containing protein
MEDRARANRSPAALGANLARVLPIVVCASATIVIAIGAMVLVGWALHVRWLTQPIPAFGPMVPNVGLMLIASAVSLLLLRPSPVLAVRKRIARALAAACVVFALATLAEDVVGRSFGIDTLLFDAPHPRATPAASSALVFANVALLTIDVMPRRGPMPAELCAIAALTIAALTIGALVYGSAQVYLPAPHPLPAGMPIHSAVAFGLLAFGILAARPRSGLMAIVTSPLLGGQVARRMLLVALAIPIFGYLGVRAERAGWYFDPGAGAAEDLASIMVAVMVTLAVARSLNRTDAERRAREREVYEWKRFFEHATFGAALGSGEARLARVNEAFARMHGYTIGELEGSLVIDLFPPQRRGEVTEALRITAEGGHHRWESEHVRKDGSVFPIVIDLFAIRDDDGKLLFRAAYVRDITEDKKRAAAVARLAALVRSADDAIVATTIDGAILEWNHASERMFGYTADEVIGRSLVDAVVPADRRVEREAIRARVMAGETLVGVESVRLRKDGSAFPIALTLSPIRDAAGRIVGISSIARDISERKKLERERVEWASIVAHDLRQPTSAIRLATEVIAKADPPPRAKSLETLRRSTDRLERMIDDLLDVSCIDAHRLTVRPQRARLSELVSEVLELAPRVAARCRASIDRDAELAWVDPARFIQVLSNLLSNAEKYSEPHTMIDVTVAPHGEMIVVSVTNEGHGIAPDEIPKLFSRFERTRSARAHGLPGLGLGLYICRGVIESLGGELWVESVPGERTHFRFTLPRAPKIEERASAAVH